jgi:hypothetical protein
LRNGAPFKDWVLPAGLERIRRKLIGSAALVGPALHRLDHAQ